MFQRLDFIWLLAKYKLQAFLTDEDGDVNIVSMVVLIGIAVLLAIVFKDQIKSLIENLVSKINTNASDALDNKNVGG